MHFIVVAGEASGDLLGADLIQALRQTYPEATIEGVGGHHMRQAGCKLLFSSDELAVMGFVDVLKHLPNLLKHRRLLLQHCLKQKPTLYIGIDAPDFNLGVEAKLKRAGIKTVHCVSPSVWAWRKGRIHGIKKSIDLMLTVLPFETAIYKKHDIPVQFIGHPLADHIPMNSDKIEARRALGLAIDQPVLAILPGSRAMEMTQLAPTFIATAVKCLRDLPNLQCVAAMANDKRWAQFNTYRGPVPIQLFKKNAQLVMAAADVVLLASGTATLEAMLVKRPMVVAYKMHPINYWIIKCLVRLKHIALPNLLANKTLVPEFIQQAATATTLAQSVMKFLKDPAVCEHLKEDFTRLHLDLKRDSAKIAVKAIQEYCLTAKDSTCQSSPE